MVDAGKLPTAGKLRAALHAAFAAAVSAEHDAQARELRGFAVTTNPVSATAPIRAVGQAGQRVLSLDEMRAYWRRIVALDTPAAALLRLHLATGCQRLAQLRRTTVDDLDADGLVLRDAKGRPDAPRVHLVPLIPPARAALTGMGAGPWLVTLDGGRSPAGRSSIHRHIARISRAMIDTGEARAPFHAGDLRRSVETRLAAEGISREIRAHLLSHGLSGVQERHYNRYDFHAEKLDALNALWCLVQGERGEPTTRRALTARVCHPGSASDAPRPSYWNATVADHVVRLPDRRAG